MPLLSDLQLDLQATATSYTASMSPSSGSLPATTTITYTLNGVLATSVVITPDALGLYGTLSPTTVTIAAGSTVGTTSFTTHVDLVSHVTSTNNQGLTDPAGVTYTPLSTFIPGTISETGHSSTTISLSSTATSGGTGTVTQQWYDRLHNTGDYASVSGATGLTATVTGLTPATAYDFAIVSTDSTGLETIAFIANLSTSASLAVGPLTQSGTARYNSVPLIWVSASGGVSPYTYAVNRSLFADMSSPTLLVSGQSGVTYDDTSVSPSTTYYYQVTVTDSVSETAVSNILEVEVPASPSTGDFIVLTATVGSYPSYVINTPRPFG